jgi:hypothetical protein
MFFSYFQIGQEKSQRLFRTSHENTNTLFKSILYLDQLGIYHYRCRYTVFALLSDTGGILELYMVLIGAILFTVSEHSFVLTASNKLYLARTTSDKIFDKIEDK